MTLDGDGRNIEQPDEAAPESTAGGAAEGDDTQGQMFLPDRTAEYLAKARERDIRQNASRRELESRGKNQSGRR